MTYRHILLIDDDSDDQEIFLCALGACCAVPCTAMSNAKEALNRLADGSLDVDLIFLDLNMPVMTGQQFLAAMKKERSLQQLPVIVLSTSSDQSTIQQIKDLGAADFITKPDTFGGLIEVLKSVVH